jgi:hypothetical protein
MYVTQTMLSVPCVAKAGGFRAKRED